MCACVCVMMQEVELALGRLGDEDDALVEQKTRAREVGVCVVGGRRIRRVWVD